MTVAFRCSREPNEDMLSALSALYPENPFQTAAYAAATRPQQGESWLIGEYEGDVLRSGCIATYSRTGAGRILVIPSVPRRSPRTHSGLAC